MVTGAQMGGAAYLGIAPALVADHVIYKTFRMRPYHVTFFSILVVSLVVLYW